MRRILALLLSLACAAALAGCGQRTITTDAGNANASNGNATAGTAANANSANAANAANSNGSREGVGPHGQGIGGTSEVNRNATVAGNSNVEPAGVNRNVGATPPPNRNR